MDREKLTEEFWSELDITEDVECVVYNVAQLMNEYRIIVEPDSELDKFIKEKIYKK